VNGLGEGDFQFDRRIREGRGSIPSVGAGRSIQDPAQLGGQRGRVGQVSQTPRPSMRHDQSAVSVIFGRVVIACTYVPFRADLLGPQQAKFLHLEMHSRSTRPRHTAGSIRARANWKLDPLADGVINSTVLFDHGRSMRRGEPRDPQ